MRPLALAERGLATPTVSLARAAAGRAAEPLWGLPDIGLEDYVDEIVPRASRVCAASSGRARRGQLDGYLRHIVDRDFEELGHSVRDPAALRRWMTAYAAASSTTASFETIRDAATGGQGEKPAKTTTLPYRDVLERLWMLDPVPAWLPTRNRISRLSSPPEASPRRPGTRRPPARHRRRRPARGPRRRAAGSPRRNAARHPLRVAGDAVVCASTPRRAEAAVKHLRTAGGRHEVDLIVERAGRARRRDRGEARARLSKDRDTASPALAGRPDRRRAARRDRRHHRRRGLPSRRRDRRRPRSAPWSLRCAVASPDAARLRSTATALGNRPSRGSSSRCCLRHRSFRRRRWSRRCWCCRRPRPI